MGNVRSTGRQAITTRYLGPTNHLGSRVVAECDAGRIVKSWEHALNSTQNHEAACSALVAKLGWDGEWVGGCDKDCRHVFVCVGSFS